MNKVVIIDSGVITHRSIFAWGNTQKLKFEGKLKNGFVLPATYHYMNTCMSVLKKIGINKDDLIIVARDGRMSWRKAFIPDYKGNRKAHRESYKHINWKKQFGYINKLEQDLHDSTNWHFILLENVLNYADLCLMDEGITFQLDDLKNFEYSQEFSLEADDIQAVCSKIFPDKEVILVTIDEDLDQLCYNSNTKIFNPNAKYKGTKGRYKIVGDPIKIIEKKVRLGDKSDNILVNKKTDTIMDVEKRRLIINLLKLPPFVERKIMNVLSSLKNKDVKYDKLPFPKSLGTKEKFDLIYAKNNIISYEDSIKAHEKAEKKKTKKRKEAYQKKKAKKQKEKEESFR